MLDPLIKEGSEEVRLVNNSSKQRGNCLLWYRVTVIFLLLAILALLVVDVVLWKTEKNCKGTPTVKGYQESPYSFPQPFPDLCGSPQKIPPLGNDSHELVQVQVIIRHGDRVQWQPKPCWPNSTAVWNCSLSVSSTPSVSRTEMTTNAFRLYRRLFEYGVEEIRGDCYVGQLTVKGYYQQLLNGVYLQQAYIDSGFLNRSFNSSEVYIRSDDESRTIQSAEGVVYGMFPPPALGDNQVEVIDIHTRDKDVDIMEANPTLCPILNTYTINADNSEEYKDHTETITDPLVKKLSSALNTNITADDIDPLMDCFVVHTCHGVPIPSSVSQTLIQKTIKELTWMNVYKNSYPSIQNGTKATIGLLIKAIFDRIVNKISNTDPVKFYLYSGHDTTLLPLLVGFSQSDIKWPPYASLMAIELYREKENPDQFAVRIVYNGQPLKLSFCNGHSTLCPWSLFKDYVENLIPEPRFCDG